MSIITQDINVAINLLRHEDIVAIPTETVYGLAGSAYSEQAIRKIFALKKRPLTHPLIMHVSHEWDLSRWANGIPDYAKQLIEAFWPGPLTLVFSSKPCAVNPLISAHQPTIALRSPNHDIAQKLLTTLDLPLVAPSANPFGKISPTTAQHVHRSFNQQPLTILDGGRCTVGIESTIIDATAMHGYQILRHGVISEQALIEIAPCKLQAIPQSIRVPGCLAQHYQPEKPLYCFASLARMHDYCQDKTDIYLLSFEANSCSNTKFHYQLSSSPTQLAYELYYQLRLADASNANAIAICLPPDVAIWQGIRERLLKAGTLMVELGDRHYS